MPKFAAGVVKFQKEVFPEKKALFERLAKGQAPEALFITCSDSRIETGLITQTDPGELFICRNAGNIVPPHDTHTGAMTASIEFAVAALKVPHIVICGHTHCGAMKGALNLGALDSMPHVRDWLAHTRAAVEIVEAIGPDMDDTARLQALTEQNVLIQLNHLRTHPAVAKALALGEVQLHGWVYDIEDGEVLAYDEAQSAFLPVSERYADEVAKYIQQAHCAA